VDSAYKADTDVPRPSFKGKTNDDWVSELTAQQFIEPFKDFEEDAQHILQVCRLYPSYCSLLTISTVYRKGHAVGRTHREKFTIH